MGVYFFVFSIFLFFSSFFNSFLIVTSPESDLRLFLERRIIALTSGSANRFPITGESAAQREDVTLAVRGLCRGSATPCGAVVRRASRSRTKPAQGWKRTIKNVPHSGSAERWVSIRELIHPEPMFLSSDGSYSLMNPEFSSLLGNGESAREIFGFNRSSSWLNITCHFSVRFFFSAMHWKFVNCIYFCQFDYFNCSTQCLMCRSESLIVLYFIVPFVRDEVLNAWPGRDEPADLPSPYSRKKRKGLFRSIESHFISLPQAIFFFSAMHSKIVNYLHFNKVDFFNCTR